MGSFFHWAFQSNQQESFWGIFLQVLVILKLTSPHIQNKCFNNFHLLTFQSVYFTHADVVVFYFITISG